MPPLLLLSMWTKNRFVNSSYFLWARSTTDESATRRRGDVRRACRRAAVVRLHEVDDRGGVVVRAGVTRQTNGGREALAQTEVGRAVRARSGDRVRECTRAAEREAGLMRVIRDGAEVQQ